MCTVIGIQLEFEPNVKPTLLSKLTSLIEEAQIRGRQATGIAYWNGERLECFKEAVPSPQFLEYFQLENIIYDNNRISCVIHTRYATTYGSLGEPQPIVKENVAVVLNGVITQEPPDKWYQLFGIEPATENDAEIALHYYLNNKLPELPGSWSLVILEQNKIFAVRNRYRPLWGLEIDTPELKGVVYCSTYNILQRSGWTKLGRAKRLPALSDLIPESYKMKQVGSLEDYYGED